MAVDRGRANRDFVEKARLERRFTRSRLEVQRRVLRVAARQLAETGNVSIEVQSAALMIAALEVHYAEVKEAFDSTARGEMPPDVEMTAAEAAELEAALAATLVARAREQSAIIAATDQRDVERGRIVALAERDRAAAEDGRSIGVRELAIIAVTVAGARMMGRLSSIVSTETQAPAELSKLAEVRELLGLNPAPAPGTTSDRDIDPLKDWVSQGDSRVRDFDDISHVEADLADPIPSSQPFEVGGERLMHPGDTSLGASRRNVVGCRCSAVYDYTAVAAARQRRIA